MLLSINICRNAFKLCKMYLYTCKGRKVLPKLVHREINEMLKMFNNNVLTWKLFYLNIIILLTLILVWLEVCKIQLG